MSQMQLLKMALDPRDVVYTPEWVAADMVSFFKPSGEILEPCCGDGVFMKYLPSAKWCEIEKGVDFFAWQTPVNYLFGNPPYNNLKEWFTHSFSIAENIVYLLPVTKIFNSYYQMMDVYEYGGIAHIRVYGAGSMLKWQMGFAIGAIHLKRNYSGEIGVSFYDEQRLTQRAADASPESPLKNKRQVAKRR